MYIYTWALFCIIKYQQNVTVHKCAQVHRLPIRPLWWLSERRVVLWQYIYIMGPSIKYVAKSSQKLTFLSPWYAHVRPGIGGLEMLIFRKILCVHLMDSMFYVHLDLLGFEQSVCFLSPYYSSIFSMLFSLVVTWVLFGLLNATTCDRT